MTPQEILLKNGCVADVASPKAIEHFLSACNRANMSVINAYLELGIDVNAYDSGHANALTKATEGNHTTVIELLVQAGANLEDKDGDGDTPLQTSINWSNRAATRKLLELGANPQCESKYGWTPLTRAIKDYNEEVVKLLLESGADVNYKSSEGNPPIWYAYTYNTSYLNLLVQKGADINLTIGDREETLLIFAINVNNESVAEQLLTLKADTSIANKLGWNPYMIALCKGLANAKLMTKLASQGVSQQQKDLALFFKACQEGKLDEIKAFLINQPNLLNRLNHEGRSALGVAATHNQKDVALFLLAQNIDTDIEAEGQWNALALAVHHGFSDLAKALIEKGFPINDKEGMCIALTQAVEKDNEELFQLLIAKGANLDSKTSYGQTPLYEAVYHSKIKFVEPLLQVGADPDIANEGGYSPIYYAIYNKQIAILKKLLQYGANPNLASSYKETPLYQCASQYNNTENIYGQMAEVLLEYGADYSLPNQWNTTPYEQTKSYNNSYVKEVIEKFILEDKRKVAGKPEDKNKGYNTETLKILIGLGEWEKVKALVEEGVSLVETRAEVSSPLHFVVEANNLEMTALFIEKGADVNYLSSYKGAVLTKACYHGNMEMVKLLLDAGANINLLDAWNESALCNTCSRGHLLLAQYLVERGASIETTELSFTPLMRAAQGNHLAVVEWLINLGANVNVVTENGYTALGLAADVSADAVAYELLRADAIIDIANYNLETPLILACKKGNVNLSRALIEKGADVHFQNKDGQTALSLIRSRKDMKKEFKELLKTETDKNKTDEKPIFKPKDLHEPDLFYAIYNHDINEVRKLVNAGADVNQRNYREDTPLMMATLTANDQMVSFLLQKGADVSAENRYKDTAWAYNMVSQNENIEKLLKKYGAKTDVNKQAGLYMRVEAFRKAINQGDIHQVEKLLLNGEVPANKLAAYESPLGLAVAKKDKELIAKILKCGVNPNVCPSNGQSILMYASSYGATETIIKVLLKVGASPNYIGNYGGTLLETCMYSQTKLIPLFVANGAETSFYNSYQKKYYSLLHELKDEQAGVVAKLAKVMDINKGNDLGENALFAYICNNQEKVATAALKAGANPNQASDTDETPLTFATSLEELNWVKLLLKHGGEPHFKPNGALSAYEIAQELENKELLALFDEHK
ncbi:MAG: ankyrin repeat domain-containing protein [Bacteroidia bacterium]